MISNVFILYSSLKLWEILSYYSALAYLLSEPPARFALSILVEFKFSSHCSTPLCFPSANLAFYYICQANLLFVGVG